MNGNTGDCPFCHISKDRVIEENKLLICIHDNFPISLGHSLVIPKRHISRLNELTGREYRSMWLFLDYVKNRLDNQFKPDGYNIGINDGGSAGQTIGHLHVHIIPRYLNDMLDPRGGIRWIIPDKARYWD